MIFMFSVIILFDIKYEPYNFIDGIDYLSMFPAKVFF